MGTFVVFTDLDGTLLDHQTYAFEAARPALKLLKDREIPLIFCSSKTRAEVERYRRLFHDGDPFIVENGGAIFIPRGYFPFSFPYQRTVGNYLVIELGVPYFHLVRALDQAKRESGVKVLAFSDLGIREVAMLTGLPLEEATLAKRREYDEPFQVKGGPEKLARLAALLEEKGLHVTRGGRFHHLTGGCDKGRAVAMLIELFRRKLGSLTTVALGDSLSDRPMLEVVDLPILVQKEGGRYDPEVQLSTLIYAPGVGPEGWNATLLELFAREGGNGR